MLWFHGSEVSTRLNLQAIIDKSDEDKRGGKRDRRDVSDTYL